MDARSIISAFASFALNLVGFVASGQSQSLINPVYGDALKSFLASLPVVGSFIAQVPSSLLLMTVSFFVVWMVIAAFFSSLHGLWGPLFALVLGGLIVLVFTGTIPLMQYLSLPSGS